MGGTYFADKAIYISDRVSWDNCLDRPVGLRWDNGCDRPVGLRWDNGFDRPVGLRWDKIIIVR